MVRIASEAIWCTHTNTTIINLSRLSYWCVTLPKSAICLGRDNINLFRVVNRYIPYLQRSSYPSRTVIWAMNPSLVCFCIQIPKWCSTILCATQCLSSNHGNVTLNPKLNKHFTNLSASLHILISHILHVKEIISLKDPIKATKLINASLPSLKNDIVESKDYGWITWPNITSAN